MPLRKPEPRKRGEPPTTRQRESRRALLVRERRESYVRELGLVDANHVGLVAWWTRHLDYVRGKWKARSALERISISELPDQLALWLDGARTPEWMRTPEDHWLVDAQHELDDDELAKVLNPAGYRRDREKALSAVRERRRKLARRR